MKKFLLILLLPLISAAQIKPVDGFGDIRFGASPTEVKQAILTLGGYFDEKNSRTDTYFFTNVDFGNHKALSLLVKFFDNKFCQASLTISPVEDENFLTYYNSLIKEVNGIYGEGTIYADFEAPYKAGDGKELYALTHQKAQWCTIWNSKNAAGDDNSVVLNVSYNLGFSLGFMDDTLIKQRDKAATIKLKAKRTIKKH